MVKTNPIIPAIKAAINGRPNKIAAIIAIIVIVAVNQLIVLKNSQKMLRIIRITTENINGINTSTPATKNVVAAQVMALVKYFLSIYIFLTFIDNRSITLLII